METKRKSSPTPQTPTGRYGITRYDLGHEPIQLEIDYPTRYQAQRGLTNLLHEARADGCNILMNGNLDVAYFNDVGSDAVVTLSITEMMG